MCRSPNTNTNLQVSRWDKASIKHGVENNTSTFPFSPWKGSLLRSRTLERSHLYGSYTDNLVSSYNLNNCSIYQGSNQSSKVIHLRCTDDNEFLKIVNQNYILGLMKFAIFEEWLFSYEVIKSINSRIILKGLVKKKNSLTYAKMKITWRKSCQNWSIVLPYILAKHYIKKFCLFQSVCFWSDSWYTHFTKNLVIFEYY